MSELKSKRTGRQRFSGNSGKAVSGSAGHREHGGRKDPQLSQVIKLVKEGREHFRRDRCREAKEKFAEALAVDPTNTYALVGCGDACRRLGLFEEGVNCYRKALEVDTMNPFSLLGLGDSLRGMGKIEKAIDAWNTLLKLQPGNVQILTRLGDAYRRTENYRQAVEVYRAALEHDPYNPYALRGMADSHRGLRQIEDAIGAWEKYILYHPDNASVLARLGDAYRQMKNDERAIATYEAALKAEENYIYAYLGMADLELGRGCEQRAREYWRQALVANSHDISPVCRRADGYRRQELYSEAEILYTMALEIEPTNKYLLTGLATIQIDRRDYARAKEHFVKLVGLYPKDEFVLTGMGDACYGLGEVECAIDNWENALAVVGVNTFLQTRIAEAHARMGNDLEARSHFVQAFVDGDRSYRTMNGLIKLLQRLPDEAVLDETWLVEVAEYALANRGAMVALEVLRHVSENRRAELPDDLRAILAAPA